MTFRICRFQRPYREPSVGLLIGKENQKIKPLSKSGIYSMEELATMGKQELIEMLEDARQDNSERLPREPRESFLSPIGLTQPIFFKGSMKTLTGNSVIGQDEMFKVSEENQDIPNLGLTMVLNSNGEIIGYTIGTDVSQNTISDETTTTRDFAAGPVLVIDPGEEVVKKWKVKLTVYRNGEIVSQREGKIDPKISFEELSTKLFDLCSDFSSGVALFTQVELVSGKNFTLESNDLIEVSIDKIGSLKNRVVMIKPRTDLDPAG